jgi:hypothetical protein
MDPLTAIETALIAGGTAAASKVATKAVTDAYDALRKLLVDTYKLASTDRLEGNPTISTY